MALQVVQDKEKCVLGERMAICARGAPRRGSVPEAENIVNRQRVSAFQDGAGFSEGVRVPSVSLPGRFALPSANKAKILQSNQG